MNIRITHLDACIQQAQDDLRRCRAERATLIESLSPHKVDDEFAIGGRRYKVRRVTASPTKASVYLDCRYWTSSNKWSQGSKLLTFEVEG